MIVQNIMLMYKRFLQKFVKTGFLSIMISINQAFNNKCNNWKIMVFYDMDNMVWSNTAWKENAIWLEYVRNMNPIMFANNSWMKL